MRCRLDTESAYDWKSKQWSIPLNATLSKVTNFGGQWVSVGGGARYWAHSPDTGPHGWAFRLSLTLLLPK